MLYYDDEHRSFSQPHLIVQGFGTTLRVLWRKGSPALSVSCLFGRVGELNVARETVIANVDRVEMCFTADNTVETTKEGSAAANQVVANRKRAFLLT